ncbi:hypothetical protein DICPUDRAFT_152021 [Dictyostelium purpureum]|uniref:Uncharacterized protein n=1 Tax=Dictyostelium purpureum TaxID=5786 RepID=F0ZKA3_DICPU|nr:uncharacterized protein DICPUDRAFT_152021 [Dictyostelium purpureum]EGC35607.1 hypothetical protein DICPUDRAFT_152021 [Dictyostelium purpureum]|eukprot:XP_003287844.1 hypothetical protein DICPUDRAFT_152021 [Dictyostelium purpureum]
MAKHFNYTLNPNTRDATSIPIMKFKDCINTLPLPVAEKKFLRVMIPRLAITGTVLALESCLKKFKTPN